jgi:hypothetical protein
VSESTPPKDAGDAPPEQKLSPEIEAALVQVVERLHHRRKMQLWGYLSALVIMIGGMVFGLWYMGTGQPGEFRGWVLLPPFALAGGLLWLFGRLARKR